MRPAQRTQIWVGCQSLSGEEVAEALRNSGATSGRFGPEEGILSSLLGHVKGIWLAL